MSAIRITTGFTKSERASASVIYEREYFVSDKVQTLGPLKHIFSFSSAIKMRFTLQAHSD